MEKNIKLEELELEKIEIIPTFNVRDNNGGKDEDNELKDSLLTTEGNIQPIIVCKKQDKYELIAGERRLRGLKDTGFKKALVIIYDNLTNIQKIELMFNENLGRRKLSWQEELKALKRLEKAGFEVNVELLKQHSFNHVKISKLLEALFAVNEYPELLKEKTLNSCIIKYRKNKRDEEGIDTNKKIISNNKLNSIVIDELKEEVNYYKNNVYDTIKKLDQAERLFNGVWLKNEVIDLVNSTRICIDFGKLEEQNNECIKCKKETKKTYEKCLLYRETMK
ncbi:MAG: ParB/RepB/Spo0J family partition protein [Candidatus Nanoarchaeia archaeon]|jgi:ParB family chromosome partitioning protein|nr:ParB/RepB/Spo0J family partition protein [Candidatus Nanoarchaeia archaeon]